MSLSLHTLAPHKGSRSKKFRVGRGMGSGRGKTAGRGTKGQRARSGGRNKLRLKGLKQMLLAFPKMRGFQSLYGEATTVPLARLDVFTDGATVTLAALKEKHLMPRSARMAKIVGGGDVKKKFVVDGLLISVSAKQALEKAGGVYKAPGKASAKKTNK